MTTQRQEQINQLVVSFEQQMNDDRWEEIESVVRSYREELEDKTDEQLTKEWDALQLNVTTA